MSVTMPAPVTRTVTVPIAIPAAEAIVRLRAAEDAARANPHWLVPTSLAVDWAETGGAIRGTAWGFTIDGTIVAADDVVTIALTLPWTAKALHDNFAPRLESALQGILG